MNDYDRDLRFDVILPRLRAGSAAQVLKICAREAEPYTGISAEQSAGLLLEKEKHISSGIGESVAIPHLQMLGVKQAFALLVTLEDPLDFNAVDNQPVDLIGFIFSPESAGPYHLRRLSRISRFLKNRALYQKLREAKDEEAIRTLLVDPQGWLLAA